MAFIKELSDLLKVPNITGNSIASILFEISDLPLRAIKYDHKDVCDTLKAIMKDSVRDLIEAMHNNDSKYESLLNDSNNILLLFFDSMKELFEAAPEHRLKYRPLYSFSKYFVDKIAEVNYNKGLEYLKIGNRIRAASFIAKANKNKYKFKINNFIIASNFYKYGFCTDAKAYFNRALAEESHVDEKCNIFYNLYLCERKLSDIEKGKKYLEKALEINPNHVLSLNEIGSYYFQKKDTNRAKEYYEKGLLIDPNNKYILYNLANLNSISDGIDTDFEQNKEIHQKILEIDSGFYLSRIKYDFLGPKKYLLTESLNRITKNKRKDKTEQRKEDLSHLGVNLNKESRNKKERILGRDQEIKQIEVILMRGDKNSVILTGEAGVGKTAIVELLASKIANKEVSEELRDKIIYQLSTTDLNAGTKYIGEIEKKVKKILDTVSGKKNIILFIDEIHTLIGLSQNDKSSTDVAQMLKPKLANGELTIIGATTTTEYKRYFNKDQAFKRRFQEIRINELSAEATKEILENQLPEVNKQFDVQFNLDTINEIINLSERYLPNLRFPDKAIDHFKNLASEVSMKGEKVLDLKGIRKYFSSLTGHLIEEGEEGIKRYENLSNLLNQEIFGQEEAIQKICNKLKQRRLLSTSLDKKPKGIFLLAGPTGVGKTYLCERLCNPIFESEKKLFRINMNEYLHKSDAARIVGSPPGYKGYKIDTPFITFFENNPTSFLLLDEIEKAHPDIIRFFLQLLDTGSMVAANGISIDFSNVSIFMASNQIIESTGNVRTEFSKVFPPEFINRIDEIVMFKELSETALEKILLNKILPEFNNIECVKKLDLKLELEINLIKEITSRTISNGFGARELSRISNDMIINPIMKEFYRPENEGKSIKLYYENNEVKYNLYSET